MKTSIFSFTAVAVLLFTGCNKDKNEPQPVNEEELITTVRLLFSPEDGNGNNAVFEFKDTDGPGGSDPVIMNDTLNAHTSYDVTVEFLNESVNPVEDITTEVGEEGTEHQIFFITGNLLNITYQDADLHGNPVGLINKGTTQDAGTGSLTVILRHQPDKDAQGVSDGILTNAGGETDVEVNFNVIVQ